MSERLIWLRTASLTGAAGAAILLSGCGGDFSVEQGGRGSSTSVDAPSTTPGQSEARETSGIIRPEHFENPEQAAEAAKSYALTFIEILDSEAHTYKSFSELSPGADVPGGVFVSEGEQPPSFNGPSLNRHLSVEVTGDDIYIVMSYPRGDSLSDGKPLYNALEMSFTHQTREDLPESMTLGDVRALLQREETTPFSLYTNPGESDLSYNDEGIVFENGAIRREGAQPTLAHLATTESMLVGVQQLK